MSIITLVMIFGILIAGVTIITYEEPAAPLITTDLPAGASWLSHNDTYTLREPFIVTAGEVGGR